VTILLPQIFSATTVPRGIGAVKVRFRKSAITAAISPFAIQSISVVDMAMVIVAVLLLWMAAVTFKKNELDRAEGAIFLLCYIGYIVCLALNI
jgi:Ca2+/Na+ antiporter